MHHLVFLTIYMRIFPVPVLRLFLRLIHAPPPFPPAPSTSERPTDRATERRPGCSGRYAPGRPPLGSSAHPQIWPTGACAAVRQNNGPKYKWEPPHQGKSAPNPRADGGRSEANSGNRFARALRSPQALRHQLHNRNCTTALLGFATKPGRRSDLGLTGA